MSGGEGKRWSWGYPDGVPGTPEYEPAPRICNWCRTVASRCNCDDDSRAPNPPAAASEGVREDTRLAELLCVIHRDGGQYIDQHGMDKAFADAMILGPTATHNAEALREALGVTMAQLGKAADQFAFYADEHAKKGTKDGDAKAMTNHQWALACAKAQGFGQSALEMGSEP